MSGSETCATAAGQCRERCLGIVGHPGPHQTTDYDDIRAEARREGAAEVLAAVERALPEPTVGYLPPGGTYSWGYHAGWKSARQAVLAAIEAERKKAAETA